MISRRKFLGNSIFAGTAALLPGFGMKDQMENASLFADDAKALKIWSGDPIPDSENIPMLDGVEFHVIKHWQPDVEGYNWLHGIALCWHAGKLYSFFGHNKGLENTPGEEARGRISTDGGKTWGRIFTIASPDEEDLGISHGVLLSKNRQLWAFAGAFYGHRNQIHTRAYVLEEKVEQWKEIGVVIDNGFWPMQEPLKMEDGNWIMSGIRCVDEYNSNDNHAAVAISEGDDITQWELRVIPNRAPGRMWGESTVFLEGSKIINISRYQQEPVALVAVSTDYGRTWSPSTPSNLPMTTSKPYTGTTSRGQHYLIGTTTANSGRRRHPLTMALTRPGETSFSKVYTIRNAHFPEGPGESHEEARLAYPYAIEHDGKLYIAYSNAGGRRGNRNSAELAVIDIDALI